jgi:hypothetical protein
MSLIVMGGRRTIARPWLDASEICYLLMYIRCRGWACVLQEDAVSVFTLNSRTPLGKPGHINPSMLRAAAKSE